MGRSRSVRAIASVFAFLVLASCGRAPDLIGIDNPEFPAASVEGASRQKLFIMTTRAADEVTAVFFGPRRAPDLGLASLVVSIPPNHVVGEIERARTLPPDPRTEFAIVDPVVYETDDAFVGDLNTELRKRSPGERDILFFVHGYNTTASDAALLLAQFVEDTGYTGVPVLFTWASAASAPRYVYDLNSALIARRQITQVSRILNRSVAESGDLFAHSMGTFLTMEGLVEQSLTGRFNSRIALRHVVLASPDIDVDLFATQLAYLPKPVRDRMFLLVSQDDRALRISRRIAGGVPRTGALPAEALEGLGLTVIDLTEVEDETSLSHSKFADSPDVVRLIGESLNNGPAISSGRTGLLQDVIGDAPIRVIGN
ncbi:MAG: alpha/beta hydrolase [Pseudomonadota bacterium]